jgi:hypothetical protein
VLVAGTLVLGEGVVDQLDDLVDSVVLRHDDRLLGDEVCFLLVQAHDLDGVVVVAVGPTPLLEGDGGVEHLDVPLVGVLHADNIDHLGARQQSQTTHFASWA